MIDTFLQRMQNIPKTRVVVAMSGGVDSSVAAALLTKTGCEVIGITMELYKSTCSIRTKTCCSTADIADARAVATQLNIAHYVLDYTDLFREKIINNFVNSYANGQTPSPCVLCNQYIKFGALLDFCKKIDAKCLVTGHYARKIGNELFRGADKTKDQSYFLALTSNEQLSMIEFPLANFDKSETREIASLLNLKTASKHESQDLCFIPDGNYKSFLRQLRPEMFIQGDICTSNATIIGQHKGIADFTIGQRKGLNLPNGPWYVKKIDISNNRIIVGKIHELTSKEFYISEPNILTNKYFNTPIEIQIRARSKPIHGTFCQTTNRIVLYEPTIAITPGQIAAFYHNNQLLGGGTISTTEF